MSDALTKLTAFRPRRARLKLSFQSICSVFVKAIRLNSIIAADRMSARWVHCLCYKAQASSFALCQRCHKTIETVEDSEPSTCGGLAGFCHRACFPAKKRKQVDEFAEDEHDTLSSLEDSQQESICTFASVLPESGFPTQPRAAVHVSSMVRACRWSILPGSGFPTQPKRSRKGTEFHLIRVQASVLTMLLQPIHSQTY